MPPRRLRCDVTQPFNGCWANFNVSSAGFPCLETLVVLLLIDEAGVSFSSSKMKQTDGQHTTDAYCFQLNVHFLTSITGQTDSSSLILIKGKKLEDVNTLL